jgi:hypothetical protein
LTTVGRSLAAAEQLVELGQRLAAGGLIDVGVDLLRGRDVRVAEDDLSIAGRNAERLPPLGPSGHGGVGAL